MKDYTIDLKQFSDEQRFTASKLLEWFIGRSSYFGKGVRLVLHKDTQTVLLRDLAGYSVYWDDREQFAYHWNDEEDEIPEAVLEHEVEIDER